MTAPSQPAPGTDPGSAPTSAVPVAVPVAVVGAGFIAEFHLDILARTPGVRAIAVCDADLERARSAARRHGVPNAVASIEELVPLGVRIAHVLVPPDLHAKVAGELLSAGIGVFLEKPMALSSSDARELEERARAAGLPLGVNHNAVYEPAFARLLERVRAGEIGRVQHVQATLNVPLRQLDAGDFSHWMFRAPRNIVFEQGPHPFSQIRELVGAVRSAEARVLGSRELHPGQTFHERWIVAAEAERGTAELYMGFGQPFPRKTIQVIGTDGFLEADLAHDLLAGERKTLWLDFWNSFLAGWRRGGELRSSARSALRRYLSFTLGLGPRGDAFYVGMRDSIRSFHEALLAGRRPHCDGVAGAEVLEWCEAATARVSSGGGPSAALPAPGAPREGEVVVLGATGFIGRRTVRALLDRGLPVTAVVRRLHTLPRVLVEGARTGKVRLVRASLEDPESLRDALRGARVVLHLATGGGASWDAIERAMVRGTVAAAEAASAQGVERFVYVSTIAALYLGHDCGHREIRDEVGPDPRPEQRALYARGKIAAESALRKLAEDAQLPLVIVRPGVVVGPGTPLQHSGFGLWVRDNHCVGWGLGQTALPLVLADDVAEALAQAAAKRDARIDGRALNLCARVPITAAEMIEELRARTGRDFHFHPRPLWRSQLMEIGKWIVKRVGGRRDAPFPSWRDLKSRSLAPSFASDLARAELDWKPCEERAELLRRAFEEPEAEPSSGRAAG